VTAANQRPAREGDEPIRTDAASAAAKIVDFLEQENAL
jgi:hypothetical protein